MSIYNTSYRSNCPPCPAPCKPCLPCDGGRIVQDKPRVDLPPAESRIQYIPIEHSIVEYEVRQRVERIPRPRKVIDYREEKRYDTVPVERTVEDYYAVEMVKQYFPQYKPRVEVQKVPVEIVSYAVDIIPKEHTRKITKQENPELFRGQYEDRIQNLGRSGEWRRVDPYRIKEGSKVTLENGQVVDGGRFLNMIKTNPQYVETKIINGDSALTKSGSGAYYTTGGFASSGSGYASGGSGYASGGYTTSVLPNALGSYTQGVIGSYAQPGVVGGQYAGSSYIPSGGYTTGGMSYVQQPLHSSITGLLK